MLLGCFGPVLLSFCIMFPLGLMKSLGFHLCKVKNSHNQDGWSFPYYIFQISCTESMRACQLAFASPFCLTDHSLGNYQGPACFSQLSFSLWSISTCPVSKGIYSRNHAFQSLCTLSKHTLHIKDQIFTYMQQAISQGNQRTQAYQPLAGHLHTLQARRL